MYVSQNESQKWCLVCCCLHALTLLTFVIFSHSLKCLPLFLFYYDKESICSSKYCQMPHSAHNPVWRKSKYLPLQPCCYCLLLLNQTDNDRLWGSVSMFPLFQCLHPNVREYGSYISILLILLVPLFIPFFVLLGIFFTLQYVLSLSKSQAEPCLYSLTTVRFCQCFRPNTDNKL